ncbi:MAG: putative DNA binding domain-containing protein [Lachnospiraceae bacterium]|nr:putative DNA binding domain-containing protein [Lachnospiraceae bacterium]
MNYIPEKETLTIEFKSDLKGFSESDLVTEIVGMANTEGGVLYLGVEDDGTPTGLVEKHKDPIGLMALIANKTVPSVSVRAEIIEVCGQEILQIQIPISRTIVATSDGRIQKRRLKPDGSPENVPLYPYEIPSRLSSLNLLDYSAQILEGAEIDDFDPNERERLRAIIKYRKGDKTLLELSDEELDKALLLVKEEAGMLKPTVTGMLLLGKEDRLTELIPTAKAMFQVLEGTKVRKNEQLAKPLLATFEIFEEYMKAWNPEREMEYGLFRVPIPEFSETAFREGLVNAFCHRDYTILQSVRLAIEDEGLTISSPGGFIEGVNLSNLLTVEPHGRNQVLADALKRIGLAEKTGRGIDRIFEGSIIYGRPLPDYSESTTAYVKLFIQRAEPDLPFAKMISDEENRLGRSLPINSLLILSALQSQRRLSLHNIASMINLGEIRTRANVEKLVEAGLVEAVGNNRSRTYILSSNIYKRQENVVGYVRQMGIETVKHEALVMELVDKQNGKVTRENVIDLLNVSGPQAYRLLKKLTDKGKLKLVGSGRKAYYVYVKSE